MSTQKEQYREYPKELDFEAIAERAYRFAEHIGDNRQEIIDTLLTYETHEVATDEIARSTDLLVNLRENQEYFQREVGPVATFLPSNQPLYATSCFAIVPSLMASETHIKAPESMDAFFPRLIEKLDLARQFPNIHVHKGKRNDFVDQRSAYRQDTQTGKLETATDVVIFTGTPEKANVLRKEFHRRVLLIVNGAGHNPIVVTETANIDKAVDSAMRVQLYNQGQDCAAPNSVLVHGDVYDEFISKLASAVQKVKVGSYSDKQNIVGPISRDRDLARIQQLLAENARYISPATDGVIRLRSGIVEPTIIEKSLNEGGNFVEQFAPVFFIQRYDEDDELGRYFKDPRYKSNAMYITLYGDSSYVENLVGDPKTDKNFLHDSTTIIRNTDLHAPGVERGTRPYGGYGKGASSISINGFTVAQPTLPQRDIYEHLVKPGLTGEMPVAQPAQSRGSHERTGAIASIHREHWGERIANGILEKFPGRDQYTIAAGASPSHTIHFGNLRDVMTSLAVVKELQKRGKGVSLSFSWDNFEPLQDIPAGLNPSLEKFIGMPLSRIPDPFGKEPSYARHFEAEFERAMQALGIEMTFTSQTDRYQSGVYDSWILDVLKQRDQYAEIMLRHMSQKAMTKRMIEPQEYRRNFYPITIYSRFTGKANTAILDFDGVKSITYKCLDTGNIETVDLTQDHIAKLKWKVEWPIRWKAHGIVFEPGGIAESGRGGSHDVARAISQEMLGNDTPIYQRYGQVKLREKPDGETTAETVGASIFRLLGVYEPKLLQWMYLQRKPEQDFSIGFDSDVIRQYDEFDGSTRRSSEHGDTTISPIPFKQAVALGRILNWDYNKLTELLRLMKVEYDPLSIESRLPKAKAWTERYNPDETVQLLEAPNIEYVSHMDIISRANVSALRSALCGNIGQLEDLEKLTSLEQDPEISPAANRERQRAFYRDIYQLLIGRNSGPRLSTLLWAMDRKKVLDLLNI